MSAADYVGVVLDVFSEYAVLAGAFLAVSAGLRLLAFTISQLTSSVRG